MKFLNREEKVKFFHLYKFPASCNTLIEVLNRASFFTTISKENHELLNLNKLQQDQDREAGGSGCQLARSSQRLLRGRRSVRSLVPVNVLYFMPGQFGLQTSVCQGDDAETLFSVVFQYLCKVLWHCRAQ